MSILQDRSVIVTVHHLGARMIKRGVVGAWIPHVLTNQVQVSAVQGSRQVVIHLQLIDVKD